MTPRELIDMLYRWEPDEPIDVSIQNRNSPSGPSVILLQGTNAINLTGDDE